jgi:hypothetical protein
MQQNPQAGGSYRREKDGSLTPIGKSQPEAAPPPTATEDETTPAAPAPRKGK